MSVPDSHPAASGESSPKLRGRRRPVGGTDGQRAGPATFSSDDLSFIDRLMEEGARRHLRNRVPARLPAFKMPQPELPDPPIPSPSPGRLG